MTMATLAQPSPSAEFIFESAPFPVSRLDDRGNGCRCSLPRGSAGRPSATRTSASGSPEKREMAGGRRSRQRRQPRGPASRRGTPSCSSRGQGLHCSTRWPEPARVVGHGEDVVGRRPHLGEARRLPDGILGPIKNKPVGCRRDVLALEHRKAGRPPGGPLRAQPRRRRNVADRPPPSSDEGASIEAIQPSVLLHADGRLQAVGARGRVSKRGRTTRPDVEPRCRGAAESQLRHRTPSR